jgi:hypothetical protein
LLFPSLAFGDLFINFHIQNAESRAQFSHDG